MSRLYLLLVLSLSIGCDQSSQSRAPWSEAERQHLLQGLSTSRDGVLHEVAGLTPEQWTWKADSATWSVAEVVEHLIVHDELFYREVRVLTGIDVPKEVDSKLFASDDAILSYREVTPANTGQSPAYLLPVGRWCAKEDAVQGYQKSRSAILEFIGGTESNLRTYYTSSVRGPTKYRDLHQLMLISIAHTERHLSQIRSIISSSSFPTQ